MEPRSSNTVAVPIMDDDRVMGTLGVTFFRSAYSRQEAIRKFVKLLQGAASDIAKNTLRLT